MVFEHGETVYRDRRKPVVDPFNPDATKPGKWSDPLLTIPLAGAFVASSSSTAITSETRTQVITAKSLYCTDPDVDVVPGDRIRWGDSQLFVPARSEADVNPFTGWQPVVEIPLEETEG